MVKNCFSNAVLFCVPAQVTTHTHYLLMQLTCTCLAWHGPYHLCFQFSFSAVRSKSGRIGQRVGTESTAEFGKCCIFLSGLPVPYSFWNFSYLTENYTNFFFFGSVTPFPQWGELEHFISRKVSRNIAHLAALTGMNTIMKSWSDISTDFAKKNHAIKF